MENDVDSKDVKFIQLVQDNPFLYGKRSGFDKSVKRSQIWYNIAQEMNYTVDQAVKKWRYLRDKYVKEKRKIKCNLDYDGNDDSNPLPDARIWPLFNYLTFLNKHVRNRCNNGKNLSIDTQRDMDFIRLVQKHSILYNKSSVSYNNTRKRAAIWGEIAFAMNYTDGDEAHKKWRYLRDKYVKYKRTLSTYDPTIVKDEFEEWPLYKCLSFLSEHVRKRRILNEFITDDVNSNIKTESKIYDSFFDDVDDDMSSNNCDNYDDKHNLNEEEELSNIIADNDNNDKEEEFVIEHLGDEDDEEFELPSNTTIVNQQYNMPIDQGDIVPEYDPFIEYEVEEVSLEQELDENITEEPEEQQQEQYDQQQYEVKEIIHQKLSPTTASDNKSKSLSPLSGSADEAFCNYVAYEMKEMSKQNKNLLKRMITNFINEKNTEQ